MLLFNANVPVHRDSLIEGIWRKPPASAVNIVQTYIGRIRRALGEKSDRHFGAEMITSSAAGYRLRVEHASIDIFRFRRAAEMARQLRQGGQIGAAYEAIKNALALCHGKPLIDVPGPWAEVERASLLEERTSAIEQRIEIELELGRYEEPIADLSRLLVEHPLHERLYGLKMRALQGAGRRAEALATFHQARLVLNDELGVEPGADLQALHYRLLSAENPTTPPASIGNRSAMHVAAYPTPFQVPPGPSHFVGRENEIRQLRALLTQEGNGSVVSVTGAPGVGKSALALHVANGIDRYFRDGVLYADLRNSDGQTDSETLTNFLLDLGIERSQLPASVSRQASLLRSAMHGKQILLVLDNITGRTQVPQFIPPAGSRMLITTSIKMTDCTESRTVTLKPLSARASRTLLERVLGEHRLRPEATAVDELIRWCDALPLALRIAAARLEARDGWPVSWLTERLRSEHRRLNELQRGTLSVRSSIKMSYDSLDHDGSGTERRRALSLLSLLPNPTFDLGVAAACLHMTPAAAEVLIEEIVDAHLAECREPGSYSIAPLVRLFARQELERCESPDLQILGVQRAPVAELRR
ncbi:BTAD domain-containing putative transcriptional regulator [Micromonospora sp. CA-248089]|uniref:AfsR/SARP family transcriptional regulator n=1 Tax=Micromonospora sp. CA-248089 TaxID=3239960 RepID=UPI003D8FCB18